MAHSRRAAVAVVTVLGIAGCGAGSTTAGKPAPSASVNAYSLPATLPPAAADNALAKGVLARIDLDGGPLRMGVGFGSLWVATHRDTFLYRIDPSTEKVVAKIDTGNESCGAPFAGAGRIWVAGCDPGPTTVVDPSSNQVVGSIPGGGLVSAVADGKVWIPDPYDVRTLHRAGSTKARGDEVVAGAGSIWMSDTGSGTVRRVDPATGRVVATFNAGDPGANEDFAFFSGGSVWIVGAGHVWQIDPRTNQVHRHSFDVGEAGQETAIIADGSLWVRTQTADVERFDLRTFRLTGHYPFESGSGGFLLVAFGSLWVSNIDASTLWRDRI